ncbi:transmembrane protein 209-like [Gigantopelta aegis]|uniref:transmembrane protein 209-like n=1 Tax=Gigantopelta aegis TaxID=1735272 RepID=UPI001B889A42|nr:transmembrane protein 209-like [Gigantopelta aegis]
MNLDQTMQRTSKLEYSNSSVVESTWKRRHSFRAARIAMISTIIITFLIFIIYIDMCYGTVSGYLDVSHPILWYLELVITGVFLWKLVLNLSNIITYLKTNVFGNIIELSSQQRILLGVRESEKGFRTSPVKPAPVSEPFENIGLFTLGSPVSPAHTSYSSDGSHHSPSFYSPSPYGVGYSFLGSSPSTSLDRSANISGGNIPYGMSNLSYGTPNLSYGTPNLTYGTPNLSYGSPNLSYGSPNLSYGTSKFDMNEQSGLRSRAGFSSIKSSPEDNITDMYHLSQYLREQQDKERRSMQASPENLSGGSPSFWSYGVSPMDCSNVLKKYQYQVAAFSPQSLVTKSSHSDLSMLTGSEEVWNKLGVTEDNLYLWTERLRKWLSLTVISRLSKEIDEINKELERIGCEDMQVGEVSISTLKQLALTKGACIPSLNTIVPYLDLSANQEYVVRRIKELGTGSMSEFTWNSGGQYGKRWEEHLPTDAALVMHCMCTYLDMRLPAHPKYPDGKTFTTQHFLKTPDKPNLEKKDNMFLYQTSINSPHFQVVIGQEVLNLPKGRNNMFHSILLFFYYIKEKQAGMLGRVNLGMSGLNLLWIFN